MALKCIVKVGGISNLSDARYCAGMGVDMLGFSVKPGTEQYVSPERLAEIISWVAGPQVVLELEDQSISDTSAYSNYNLIELNLAEASQFTLEPQQKLIIRIEKITEEQIAQIRVLKDHLAYLIIHEDLISHAKTLNEIAALLLAVTSDKSTVLQYLDTYPLAGIELKGGIEEKTGFKDYEALADLLETLEVE
ncbi:MAG TPA: hypothetical protein PKC24_11070 [Cyclobacteriaceae bacterium]|nr:hypothetical protein [Cyclobacteriaceae bacterium]